MGFQSMQLLSVDIETRGTLGILEMWVPGRPQTAGSKRAFKTKIGKVVVTESGDRSAKASWRSDLRDAAIRKRRTAWTVDEPVDVPIAIEAVFVRPRPSSQMRSGRHAGALKDSAAPLRPVSRPDATKLLRAAEDALTGVLWIDDAQIVYQVVHKAWGDDVGLDPRAEGLLLRAWQVVTFDGPRVVDRSAL